MHYISVDASLNGTGIRDEINGGFIEPTSINLSETIKKRLSIWLEEYANEHYNGYNDKINIERLDKEGKEIAMSIYKEIGNAKINYYSDAKLIKTKIE